MRKWRKNGVVAEKPKPENPCKSRKNRRRMSIYEIRYRNFIILTINVRISMVFAAAMEPLFSCVRSQNPSKGWVMQYNANFKL